MLPVIDKLAGGTIPGPGNYTADEFNQAVKRDLLSTVLLTQQTPTGANFLQLSEALSRIALTGNIYQQSGFSTNNYSLQTSGYTGAIDPSTNPPAPQNYNGPSFAKGAELIIFQAQDDSVAGTAITVNIAQMSLTNVPVVAPTYELGTAPGTYRTLDQSGDFKANEYVVMRYDGTQFVIVSILSSDVFRQATETLIGSVRIATAAQVLAGTDDTTAITPLKLEQSQSGSIIQVQQITTNALDSLGPSLIPRDNSIPQISEGSQYINISFTPKKSTSLLKVESLVTFTASGSSPSTVVALFRDAVVDSFGATCISMGDDGGANAVYQAVITAYIPAVSTSATTFSARIGDPFNQSYEINGGGGTEYFGGVCQTNITVSEISQ